jgi:hypothetical protein
MFRERLRDRSLTNQPKSVLLVEREPALMQQSENGRNDCNNYPD